MQPTESLWLLGPLNSVGREIFILKKVEDLTTDGLLEGRLQKLPEGWLPTAEGPKGPVTHK